MAHRPAPIDPALAEQQFAEMLEKAGLPRFTSAHHDPDIDELQLVWDHGFTLHIDLTRRDTEPIDDRERAAILGLQYQCKDHEPIHVIVPGSADDARDATSTPGVVIHRQPPLHPDDLTTLNGIPVTSPPAP